METESSQQILYQLQKMRERVDLALELLDRELAETTRTEEKELIKRSQEHLKQARAGILRLEGRITTLRDLGALFLEGFPPLGG